MRADSSVPMLPGVAIRAEKLKTIREVFGDQPLDHVGLPDLATVFPTVPVDVVDLEEERFRLSAASARPAVVHENGTPLSLTLSLRCFPLLCKVSVSVLGLPLFVLSPPLFLVL